MHLVGFDLDGNEIDIQTDEYEGRIFQHEMDHLDGVLLIERLDADQRREAKILLREHANADRRQRSRRTPSPLWRVDAPRVSRHARAAVPSLARPG